jgi:hypothetical protein
MLTRLPGVAAVACMLAALMGEGATADPRRAAGESYFIDFRARPSTFIGHTFIIYGRVNANGRVTEHQYAGLIPEEDVWRGLLAPIRATVRKYKDDAGRKPTVIYRRRLTPAEFDRVTRVVRLMKSAGRQWHVVFFNCNDFAIEVAEALGMARPPSLLPPSVWVAGLRALNGP